VSIRLWPQSRYIKMKIVRYALHRRIKVNNRPCQEFLRQKKIEGRSEVNACPAFEEIRKRPLRTVEEQPWAVPAALRYHNLSLQFNGNY